MRDPSKIVFKAGNLEKMSSDRTATFIASDESEDLHGDIIRVKGWDLTQFKRNPVLLWGHKSDEPPIGKVTSIGIRGKQLVADVKFLPAEVNAFAEQIYQTVKAGILNAVSVGFQPLEYGIRKDEKDRFVGYEFTKQALHELSVVSVPSDPNALAVAKALHIDVDKFFAPPVVSDTMKGNRRYVDVLKLRV